MFVWNGILGKPSSNLGASKLYKNNELHPWKILPISFFFPISLRR